jgi:hypothetical protein
MSFLKWRGESAAKKAGMSIADGRRVGDTLLLGRGSAGEKRKNLQKNLSSAGPRPRKCAAVDLLMKGFLGVWIGFVGLFEPTPQT